MATNPPVRPLPTALQTRDPAQRRSRVSFTSGESSNNHSGESSYQFVGSNASSQTSHSSSAPLPKGARPPSPQSFFAHHYVGARRNERERASMPSRRTSASSSWKFEWRGFSKVIKWAVLGDKISEPKQLRRAQTVSAHRTHSSPTHAWHSRNQDDPVRQGPQVYGVAYDHDYDYITSQTTVLSPEDSTSGLNKVYENEQQVTHSEVGHNIDYTSYGQTLSSASYQTPQLDSSRSLEHARNVRKPLSHNVQYARPEYARHEDAAFEEPQGAISEVGHVVPLNETSSSPTVPHPTLSPTTRSDIGHGSAAAAFVHPSGMASTSFFSTGHVPFPSHPSNHLLQQSTFHGVQSAIALPSSTGFYDEWLSTDRQRRRKLRKSIRKAPLQSDSGHGLLLPPLLAHTSRPSSKASKKVQRPSLVSSSAFSTPISPPRPPRKLTKRPSPQLPAIPNTGQSALVERPPPVPPKPRPILKNKNESPLPPLPPLAPLPTPNHSSDSSMPALTNTSYSTSYEDENTRAEVTKSEELASSRPKRPSFLRTESNRRWTVAVADVPDDMFIEEFDRLRRMGLRAGEVHGIHHKHSQPSFSMSTETKAVTSVSERHAEFGVQVAGHPVPIDQSEKRSSEVIEVQVTSDDELEWTHARKAIMCCRELVRTERSYQARLQDLAEGHVSDTVPKLLLQYLPALITASKNFSSHLNEDMSTSGVSRAFIQSESVLEDAFLAWCGVVGEFFGSKREAPMLPRHKRGTTVTRHVMTESTLIEKAEDIYRLKSMHSHEEVYVAPALESEDFENTGERVRRTGSMHWLFRPAFSHSPTDENNALESFLNLRKSFRKRSGSGEDKKKRKPPFRELAILPTQRVTRYVLLYKDLLKHTTATSQSREIVEKAVKCAESLARKCDRVQGNAAFLR